MSQRTFFQIAFIIAFVYSWYLFFNPELDSGIDIPHIDKLGHFIIFGGLSFLFDFAFGVAKWLGVLIGLVYGISVELIQGNLPNRQASIADIVADLAGCLVYYYGFRRICHQWVGQLSTKFMTKEQDVDRL